MHPEPHHPVPGHCLGLRDFRLVVGKDVVGAPGVDVEPLSKERERHRRTLDVPTGKSLTPGTRPHLLPMLASRLPEGEVAWMLLAGVGIAAYPDEQGVGRIA